MACQICLEDFSDLLIDDPKIVRVTRLCGADCSADVCSRCLLKHIQTILNSCIRGMLPRVRCPICLVAIGKAQWNKFAPAGSVQESVYEQLTATALSFQSPCCHEGDYTHLPEYSGTVPRVDVSLLSYWKNPPQSFQTLIDDFVNHRLDASRVVAFLDSEYQGIHYLEGAMLELLGHIYDSERRAALYLSYLYRYPATTTTCCGKSVCFNCKGTECGDVCEEVYQNGFDESACMVRCRSCRVMLVVTEGCNSVYCPCGFPMGWAEELQYRNFNDRGLLSVDMFDLQLMDTWVAKRTMLSDYLTDYCEAFRLKQLERLINDHRSTLLRLLGLWRRRRQHRLMQPAMALTTCSEPLLVEDTTTLFPVEQRELLSC